MGGTTMGLAPKGMRMVMEVHPIPIRFVLGKDLPVVVKDIVKADVAAPRIDLIIHMVDAEPVVDPSAPD